MFAFEATPAMKTPDPEPEAEDPQAQQIDLDDADVSAELASDPRLPPGASSRRGC